MANMADFESAFFDAYVACALWSSNDPESDVSLEDYDGEIFPETLEEMREDCADFVAANWEDLRGLDAGTAGHDFWLTRNRHGAGFWDRGLGELGKRLTAASHAYGSVDLYIGDDGQIHGS